MTLLDTITETQAKVIEQVDTMHARALECNARIASSLTGSVPVSAAPFGTLLPAPTEMFDNFANFCAEMHKANADFAAHWFAAWDGEPASSTATARSAAPKARVATSAPKAATGTKASPPKAASAKTGSDITDIKGIGPKFAQDLLKLGIGSIAELAVLQPAAIERIRIAIKGDDIDGWVAQAKVFVSGR